MTTIQTITAAEVAAGDFIHRVERRPLSAVFEAPVDQRVTAVEPLFVNGVEYVTIHLDGPYNRRLNLAPARKVEVAR
jgi:hypothetical protein